jgi:general secretion pathway protein I
MIREEKGFTLLEALVALAIAAFAAAAAFSSLQASAAAISKVEETAAAITIAKARLAAIGIETPLEAGETSGTAHNGMQWTARVWPRITSDNSFSETRPAAYWISVDVLWRNKQNQLQSRKLTTLKLARDVP